MHFSETGYYRDYCYLKPPNQPPRKCHHGEKASVHRPTVYNCGHGKAGPESSPGPAHPAMCRERSASASRKGHLLLRLSNVSVRFTNSPFFLSSFTLSSFFLSLYLNMISHQFCLHKYKVYCSLCLSLIIILTFQP